MALVVAALQRVFEIAGRRLGDPDPAATPAQAVQMLALMYPDLGTAEIRGPEQRGDEMVYTLHRAVGTKGSKSMAKRLAGFQLAKTAPLDPIALHAVMALALNDGKDMLGMPGTEIPWLG